MSDDDDPTYTSDEDYNEEGSNDEDNNADEYQVDEYMTNNDKYYEEQDRQFTKFHSESSPQHPEEGHSGRVSTNVIRPIPTVRSARLSNMSNTKQSEEDVAIASQKSASTRRNHKPRDSAANQERRSQNTTNKLTANRSGGSSHTQPGRRSSGDVERSNSESNHDRQMDFPLRNIAAGVDNTVSIRDARALEMFAKKNLKLLKADLQIAQLDVAEAKLAEFSAKLQARQVKIHERHAKLCKRRAMLKQAEDDQTALERKLDEEEDDHRDRERRVKNRQRRVKQEEAGLRIKEAALRKREIAVSQGIERIERWREIVEEKEKVHKQMEDILQRKQEIQGRAKSSRNSGIFSSGNRRTRQNVANGGAECSRKQDIIGHIISGIRRQHIVGTHAAKGSCENSDSHSAEIKSGAPSIWL